MKPFKFFAALLVAFAVGCVDGGAEEFDDLDNEPSLAELDAIIDGVPKADELERIERKSDEILPPRFTELLSSMTPVKNQGSRGMCSMFSSIAQMEHLYLSAGYEGLDFAEQYLQWSGKIQAGFHPNAMGHSVRANLLGLSQFGVVEERFWPYESMPWDESDDGSCTGRSDQPTRCYTNGSPPEEALGAPRYKLPRGFYLHPQDFKVYIRDHRTPVVAGVRFFYQSWNHGRSELPINRANWRRGIVMAPNRADRLRTRRSGHAILILGWDDEMEAQRLDGEGELLFAENGEPMMEKGFYLFKNSWGTDSFGVENEEGSGYGWISQAYVHEFGHGAGGNLPRPQDLPGSSGVELCDDGVDNDGNGKIDCADEACAEEEVCSSGKTVVRSYQIFEIPDFNGSSVRWVSSPIKVDIEGRVGKLSIDVNISHGYIGDLKVSLRKGNTTVILHDREGRNTDNIWESFVVTDFVGESARGTWELLVGDFGIRESGLLNGWSMQIDLEEE